MSSEAFASRLLRSLEEKAQGIRQAILSGAPKDHSDYKRLVGELRGIDTAAFLVRDQLAPELEDGHPLRNKHLVDKRTP